MEKAKKGPRGAGFVKIFTADFLYRITISILSVREQILRTIFAERRHPEKKHSVRPLLVRAFTRPVGRPFFPADKNCLSRRNLRR